MTLSSSPPCGPCSVSQSVPVARIEGQALRIAVAHAPDFRQRARAAHERIVLRHAAVVVQAQDLALMAGKALRRVPFEVRIHRAARRAREQARHAVADRHEQMSLAVERDARAEVTRRVVPGLRFEDFLRIDELVALELGTHQRGRAFDAGRRGSGLTRWRGASACCCGAVTWLRIAQVDEMVLREVRVHGDFLHAALALRAHGRYSGHRRRQQLAAADDAQRAGVIVGAALRDEHVAVR